MALESDVCRSQVRFILSALILLSPLSFAAGAASFTRVAKNKTVEVGKQVTFVWNYTVDNKDTDFGLRSPIWDYYNYSTNTWLEIASENDDQGWNWTVAVACPPSLKGRISKKDIATLVIDNVQLSDKGIYRCKLDVTTGSTQSREAHLTVIPASTTPTPSPIPDSTTPSSTATPTPATTPTPTRSCKDCKDLAPEISKTPVPWWIFVLIGICVIVVLAVVIVIICYRCCPEHLQDCCTSICRCCPKCCQDCCKGICRHCPKCCQDFWKIICPKCFLHEGTPPPQPDKDEETPPPDKDKGTPPLDKGEETPPPNKEGIPMKATSVARG